MHTTLENKIQNGTYWSGFVLGLFSMLFLVLAIDRMTDRPEPSQLTMPRDVVEAYRMGIKDALKTNPPSLDLEQTCVSMWANKQPVKE
jgi:hypothetical protein